MSNVRIDESHVPFVYGGNLIDVNKDDCLGLIEFYHEISLETVLHHPNQIPVSDNEYIIYKNISDTVCLMVVPSFMIPGDILHYFSSSFNDIVSIRIVRHYSISHSNNETAYIALIKLINENKAVEFMQIYRGRMLTSLKPTVCIVYFLKTIKLSFSHGVNELMNYDQLLVDVQTVNVVIRKFLTGLELSDDNSKENMTESEPSAESDMKLKTDNYRDLNDANCVLCLEAISKELPKNFTTFCKHTFHIDCLVKVEGPQCPVCRFQHDSSSLDFSQCCVCGWPGNDTLYSSEEGHSTIETFNLQIYDNSVLTPLSQDSDVWVCLICGFIGCGLNHGIKSEGHIQSHYNEYLHTYAINTDTKRVWDFAGDGYVHRLILSQNSTAGNEVMSEFSLNSAFNGSSMASSSFDSAAISSNMNTKAYNGVSSGAFVSQDYDTSTSMKVVEVFPQSMVDSYGSPSSLSTSMAHEHSLINGQRSHEAPLTSDQEEYLINSKLESTAYHYNQLLHWQLERNREMYEMNLQKLKEFARREGNALANLVLQPRNQVTFNNNDISSSSASSETNTRKSNQNKNNGVLNSSFNPKYWTQCVIETLLDEKSKIMKHCETAKKRLSTLQEEIALLNQFHSNLDSNQQDYRKLIEDAEKALEISNKLYADTIEPLEQEVQAIMSKLDESGG